MFKKVFVLSIAFNIMFGALGCFYLYKKGGISKVMAKPVLTSSAHYLDRTSLFNELPLDSDSVVFLGDSITAGNEWFELFQNTSIKNRGIIGDTTTGLLNRLDSITKYQPKQIFLLYGTNDLQDEVEISMIAENYKKIVGKIKQASPESEILIQSVLPVNSTLDRSKRNNNDIQALNKELKRISKETNVTFIDLYADFVNGTELDKRYTHDGLHLSGEGYIHWKKKIEPFIK